VNGRQRTSVDVIGGASHFFVGRTERVVEQTDVAISLIVRDEGAARA